MISKPIKDKKIMSTLNVPEEELNRRFKSVFTACGFLIAHYTYILAYSLFNHSKYGDGAGCLLYASLGALFIWLFIRLKKEPKFQNLLTIIIIYLCERSFTLGQFYVEEDYGSLLLQAAIFAPIAFFLVRGLKSSIDLRVNEAAKTKRTSNSLLIARSKASKKAKKVANA
jgi:hypothetical protein